MSPKEYFKAYFSNEQDFKKIETDILADPLLDGFDYKELLDTSNYKYSNSIEFEQLVKGFLQNSPYFLGDLIYIGKLANSYPNCYTIENNDINGCLVCITSGLTENSYIIAKLFVLQNSFSKSSLNKAEYDAYKKILENDILRRIHQEYGGQIRPGDTLHYAEVILRSKLENLMEQSARFSYVMDLFTLYHEYSHYILKKFQTANNQCAVALVIKMLGIYSRLCKDMPVYGRMPKEEVCADILALWLFSDLDNLGIAEVIAMLLSIVQLRKMSSEDIYTNNYRVDLFYYCLTNYSASFRESELEIRKSIQEFIDLFDREDDPSNTKESWDMLHHLLKLSDNPNEAILFILNDRLQTLTGMEFDMQEHRDDEFEDFE